MDDNNNNNNNNADEHMLCGSFSHGLKQNFLEHARYDNISYSRVVIDLDVLEWSYGFHISCSYGAAYSFLLYHHSMIAMFLHVREALATTWHHSMLYGL